MTKKQGAGPASLPKSLQEYLHYTTTLAPGYGNIDGDCCFCHVAIIGKMALAKIISISQTRSFFLTSKPMSNPNQLPMANSRARASSVVFLFTDDCW